jgi:hypothetical protein
MALYGFMFRFSNADKRYSILIQRIEKIMKKLHVIMITFVTVQLFVPFTLAQRPQEPDQEAPAIAADEEPYFSGFMNYLRGAGREGKLFKSDQFMETEMARGILESLYFYRTYGLEKQDDPAITAFWASRGLTKEIYQINDTNRMWSVFTPNGIYNSYDEDHRFPVVFCLHGNTNDIMLTETYGFADLGGKEGYMTVIPWAQNEDIILEEVPRILAILRNEGYPIDESRIYATGFSKGGMATMRVGMEYPGLFAAIAPGGMGAAGIVESSEENNGRMMPSFGFTEGQYSIAAKYRLPVLFFGGTCDNMPLSANASHWIGITGAVAPKVTEETVADITAHSGYGVERMTGLQFSLDEMEIRLLDGTYYYIGSYYNEEGICTFRSVAVEGAPHWLVKSEAAVVWEFLSQFARDPATGRLLYTD